MKSYSFLLLCCLALILNSCIKSEDFDYDKIAATEWNPEVAIPLVYSSTTIKDIIGYGDTSIFAVDPNRLVSLIYRTDLISTPALNLVTVPSASYTESVSLNVQDSTNLASAGSVTKNINRTVPFAFPGTQQIDSLILRQGYLRVTINNNIPRTGIAQITLPFAERNGLPFSANIIFNSSGGNISDTVFDLSQYSLKFANNAIGVNYDVTFNQSSSSGIVTQRNCDISLQMDSLVPSAIFGYFGQLAIDIPIDTAEISIFKNTDGGVLFLTQPQIEFKVTNSFGIPVNLITNSVYGIDNSINYPLTGYPSPFAIGYPSVPGQTITSSFVCDTSNSNVRTILTHTPANVVYDLAAVTNPAGTGLNFILDSSKVNASVTISFPLKGYGSAFVIQDTADFRLDRIEELQSAIFRITAKNEFPAEAYTQVYFADSVNTILDSMLLNPSDLIIQGALTGPGGQVIAPQIKTTDQPFDAIRLSHIYNARKLFIRSVINTTNAPNSIVSIYDFYRLEVKIGVNAKLKVNVN